MIIIEGCDNTGKSQLGRRLARDISFNRKEVTRYSVLHSPGPMDRGQRMVEWLLHEINESPRPVIYDRISLISDEVYSPIIRKEETFYTRMEIKKGMKKILLDTPHIIIFCRPSKEAIYENGAREQMEGVIENLPKLVDAYDRMILEYQEEGFDVFVYNYELGGIHYSDLLQAVFSRYLINYTKEEIK